MRISVTEQLLLIKRLSTLVTAGVPLLESLRLLSVQAKGGVAEVIGSLVGAVSSGRSLAAGLADCGNVVSPLTLHLIEVGEQTGMLPEHLRYVTEQLGQQQTMRRKIWSALVYPLFVFVIACAVALLLLLYVFPKLMPIFSSLHFKLPLTTRILLGIYTTVTKDFIALLLCLGLALVAVYMVAHAQKTRTLWYRAILRVPIIRSYLVQYQNWHICRTLAVLLKAEVPLARALEKTAQSMQHMVYRTALSKVHERVLDGASLAASLQWYPALFPLHVTQLLQVGEQAGTLTESLAYCALMLQEETEELTKKVTVLFEPALLLVVGLVVGFVAIAIITPIYGITQAIHF